MYKKLSKIEKEYKKREEEILKCKNKFIKDIVFIDEIKNYTICLYRPNGPDDYFELDLYPNNEVIECKYIMPQQGGDESTKIVENKEVIRFLKDLILNKEIIRFLKDLIL